MYWTNVAGVTTASPNPGVAAGFLSTAPDTTCTSGVSCTYYFDNTNGTYPFRDQPCVGHNQVVTPCYAWLNTISGSPGTVFHVAGANTNIVNNRDYYDYVASFTGATGTGSGLFSAIPSSCTPDVGYFATDQNTLYVCTSTNTWTADYSPYPYPDPLIGGSVVATPTFSPPGGGYTSAQTVTISCATPSAIIYYTLDGSLPNPGIHGSIYSTPITVSSSETIQAVGSLSGFTSSNDATAIYYIGVAPAPGMFASMQISPGTMSQNCKPVAGESLICCGSDGCGISKNGTWFSKSFSRVWHFHPAPFQV